MKLLGSTKKDVDKDENGESVLKLESAEVVLVHFNLVKNDCQHIWKVLFTKFVNKIVNKYFATFFNNDEDS